MDRQCRLAAQLSPAEVAQVRALMERQLGNQVVALHRDSIADIVLDPNLAPGEYRPLTAAEIASIDDV